MSSSGGVDRAALGYAVGNVSSSVSLVLINKWVFNGGFMFPMTLTFFHFCFTVFFYRGLAAAGLFEPKSMPASEAFKMAAAGVGSIGFMNISLHLNSVGFYQITKLSIVPMTLAAQAVLFGVSTSTKIKLSLLVLILGLGIATVTDVQLNAPGFVIGILAVLTTTIFQLWQGSKQKEYELSGVQLQSAVSFWQAAQSLAAAIALENLCVKSLPWEGDDVSRECNTAVAYISDVETHGARRAARPSRRSGRSLPAGCPNPPTLCRLAGPPPPLPSATLTSCLTRAIPALYDGRRPDAAAGIADVRDRARRQRLLVWADRAHVGHHVSGGRPHEDLPRAGGWLHHMADGRRAADDQQRDRRRRRLRGLRALRPRQAEREQPEARRL